MMSYRAANPIRTLIRGVVSIAAGITVVAVPGLSLTVVMQVLGVLLIIDGAVALLINHYGKDKSTFWIVPRGTTNLIIGIVLLVFPKLLVNVFVFVIGVILILAGLSQLSNIVGIRGSFRFSWFLLIISLVSLSAGIILVVKPFESIEVILTYFGIILTIYGFGEVIWSFKIRKMLSQQIQNSGGEVDAEYEELD